jgi:hypothetical protein
MGVVDFPFLRKTWNLHQVPYLTSSFLSLKEKIKFLMYIANFLKIIMHFRLSRVLRDTW